MRKLIIATLFYFSCIELFSQDNLMKYNSEKIEFIKISKKDYVLPEKKTNDFFADTNLIRKRNGKFELRTISKIIIISDTISIDETSNAIYEYIGKNDCISQYIIKRILYESSEYYLIDIATGKPTYIWNLPKVSPDCKYVCSLNLIWGMGSYSGGILILKRNKARFVEYFKIEYENWISIDGHWKSDAEFYFKIIPSEYLSYSAEQRVEKNNEDKIRYWKILMKE